MYTRAPVEQIQQARRWERGGWSFMAYFLWYIGWYIVYVMVMVMGVIYKLYNNNG